MTAVQITVSRFERGKRRLEHCDYCEVPSGMTWRRVARQLLVKGQMRLQEPPEARRDCQRGD